MKVIQLQDFFILKKKIYKNDLDILIISGSMEPFIATNEKIKVTHIHDLNKLKKFTPVVFFKEDKLVCHLFLKWITKEDKVFFLSKGINSSQYDKLTEKEHILGEVIEPKMNTLRRIFLRVFFK